MMQDIEVIRTFAILNRLFLGYFADSIAGTGVSYSEGIILVNIGYQPGASQDCLAAQLVIDKAAVARSAKALAEKGLITATRSAGDRRANSLRLTEEGGVLFARIQAVNRRWVDGLCAGLPAADLRAFHACLQTMGDRAKAFPDLSSPNSSP